MELICLDALLLTEILSESGDGFVLVVIMENIYKIKVKTNPSPLSVYPSERRYSASTVLGLGVVHLALAITTLLLASLTLTTSKEAIVSTGFTENQTEAQELLVSVSSESVENKSFEEVFVVDRITTPETIELQDLTSTISVTSDLNTNETYKTKRNKRDLKSHQYYTNIAIAPCVMTLGSMLAGVSALLAWKRWYIDNNIKWFFISSCASVLTSLVCLLLTSFTVSAAGDFNSVQFSYDFPNGPSKPPNFSLVVAVNILIASAIEVIWSILSAKIAYKGMISNYPEDIVISRSGGRTEVYTERKGNKKVKMTPPDIISHFPNSAKLAKYLPKKEERRSGNLPKEESSKEYRERVNKFLTEQNVTSTEDKD